MDGVGEVYFNCDMINTKMWDQRWGELVLAGRTFNGSIYDLAEYFSESGQFRTAIASHNQLRKEKSIETLFRNNSCQMCLESFEGCVLWLKMGNVFAYYLLTIFLQ